MKCHYAKLCSFDFSVNPYFKVMKLNRQLEYCVQPQYLDLQKDFEKLESVQELLRECFENSLIHQTKA